MTFRRLGGLLSAALLLRLNLVAVDFACARHDVEAAPASAPAASVTGHEHHAPERAPDDSPQGQTCDVPVSAGCCIALTSCSLTLNAGTRSDAALRAAAGQRIALGTDRPTFHGEAPEPPPPKS